MSKKQQVAKLMKRYQFIDFAKIVSCPHTQRKERLRAYLDRDSKGRWRSYKGLRSLIPDIAGVKRPLDLTKSLSLEDIKRGLKGRCHPLDLDANVEAATVLYEFLRTKPVDAYNDHPSGALHIGPDRTINMEVEHYVVDGERGAFRWVYPRRERLEGNVPTIVMSLIHHNFVGGDFSEFGVQLIDLSCEPIIGPRGGVKAGKVRSPRIIELTAKEILPREELNSQANQIYGLLMELSEET